MAVAEVEEAMELPPGFRFHPTDEEIITHYLSPRIINRNFTARAMGDVDLNKCEPWDLPNKAKMGEKEWYFFCQRDRKYPTGMRTNRATEAGYWKATGKDKEIFRGRGVLVGMKKTLVFYRGRAPRGEKTNWVMHEYRLEGKSNLPKSAKDEWSVCRVFHKNMGLKKGAAEMEGSSINSSMDDFLDSTTLPPLMEPQNMMMNSNTFNNNEAFEFKNMPNTFSTLLAMDNNYSNNNHQMMVNQFSSIQPHSNVGFYHQVQQQLEATSYSMPGLANYGYLHQYPPFGATNDASSAIRRHSKVEQYSNQSIGCPSQDTGLSTDHNTEISSVVSRPFEELDDPNCSAAQVMDMESFWKF